MTSNIANIVSVKKQVLGSLLMAALAAPTLAQAEEVSPHTFSANLGVTSDYIFRGITQTSHNPALQGGVDYAHASGLYAGLWASNVSWIADSGAVATGSVSTELDTYAGFRNTLQNEFNYDVGFIRYNYLGSYTAATGFAKADTDEVYLGIGYKWVSAKYSHGLGNFLTVPGAQGTNYLEVNANVPLGESGYTLGAHTGKQTFKPASASIYTYTDYKLGISKDFSGFLVGLAYTNTNTNAGTAWTYATGGNWGKSVTALSVSHSF